MFVSSTQFFIMAPLLPQIGRQLCVNESILGILVGTYSFALGISALFAGFISDKIGRRQILLFGSGLMALSLLLHGLAMTYTLLLALRLVAGISGGILTGSCIAYVRDFFPYEKRGWANGMIITGSAFGQMAGIPLGILLSNLFGFSVPFVAMGALMAVSFFLINRFVPQTISTEEKVNFKLKQLVLDYRQLISQSFYRKAALGYILMFFSVTIYLVYFPKWLEETKGATAQDLAILFLLGGVATLIGGPVSGKLADKVGRIPVTTTTSISMAGAMGVSLFFQLDVFSASLVFFMVMLFLTGRSISYQSKISDRTCEKNRGKTMNLMISLGQIGMGLGSVLAGIIYTSYGFEMNTLLAVFASVIMAFLVAGRWIKTEQPNIEEETSTKQATSSTHLKVDRLKQA